ncbi:hypothetical protein HYD81_00860 [Mycoplasmopsis bovis]|nr:hypothetical protein HYD81_00860 [Mycoplasmopsis bovis]
MYSVVNSIYLKRRYLIKCYKRSSQLVPQMKKLLLLKKSKKLERFINGVFTKAPYEKANIVKYDFKSYGLFRAKFLN